MKIITVIPTLNEDPTPTIQSLLAQSLEVSKIYVVIGSTTLYDKLAASDIERTQFIYVKPYFSQLLGKRVAAAINAALSNERLEEYDYVFKLDADVILPKKFVEMNLQDKPDFIGSGGAAMLFTVSSFLKVFAGKYPEVAADDTYFASKFLYDGYSVKRWVCPVQIKSQEKRSHSYRHQIQRGIELYKLGYEPVHILDLPREIACTEPRDVLSNQWIFQVAGYFLGVSKRVKRYEFAPWIFKMQVRRLIYGRQFAY